MVLKVADSHPHLNWTLEPSNLKQRYVCYFKHWGITLNHGIWTLQSQDFGSLLRWTMQMLAVGSSTLSAKCCIWQVAELTKGGCTSHEQRWLVIFSSFWVSCHQTWMISMRLSKLPSPVIWPPSWSYWEPTSGRMSRFTQSRAHRLPCLCVLESFSHAQQMKQVIAAQVVLQGPKKKIGIQKNAKNSRIQIFRKSICISVSFPFAFCLWRDSVCFSTTGWHRCPSRQGLSSHKENSFANHSGLF